MKYSIKSLCVLVLFVALSFTAMSAWWRSNALNEKLHRLEKTHGLITQDYGQDGERFEVVQIGNYTSDFQDIFLVRVTSANQFRLRVHFFDGESGKYTSATHDLNTIETAIRLLPSFDKIYINPAVSNTGSDTVFEIDGTDRYFVRGGQRSSDLINDKPIHLFLFLTDSSEQPTGANPQRYVDRIAIEKTCKKHRMRAAWFTIE